MTFDWRVAANQQSGAKRISNINNFMSLDFAVNLSPIDNFYSHRGRVIDMSKPKFLSSNKWISGYLLASVVSSTELYFREMFGLVLGVCQNSQVLSSEQNLHLGSAVWHGDRLFSKAAFEHISFAEVEKIRKCSKDFLGYEIKPGSGSHGALAEYGKICELRHGIVHSGLHLPGKNAVKLSATKTGSELLIGFGVVELQESIAVCESLVESYNSELFQEIVRRWATSWRVSPGWIIEDEKKLFKEVCNIFISKTKPATSHASIRKIMNAVKKEYAII